MSRGSKFRRIKTAQGVRTRRLAFESLEDRRLLAGFTMSVEEQIVVELINYARAHPTAAAAYYGIDLNQGLAPGTISPSPKQPLAPNQRLINAARAHSQDMVNRQFFDHVNPDNKNPRDRMVAAGYTPDWWGENIATGYFNESHFQEGLFLSPGHRTNIMLDNFREIGVGFADTYPVTGTQKFGSQNTYAFFTGVAFSDQRVGDNFLSYDENLAGVTIAAQQDGGGPIYTTTTGPSGGYSLPLPPGVYDLAAQGGDLAEPILVSNISIGTRNVKVDFVVPFVAPEADRYEPNNQFALAVDLGYGDQSLEHLSIHDEDDQDYFLWTPHQNGQLTVELDLRGDTGSPDVVLLDDDENWLQFADVVEHGKSLTYTVEAGKTYGIWVTAHGIPWEIHRDYTLTIDGPGGVAPQPDTFEPNDNFAAALDVGSGDRTLNDLTVHEPGDRDFFLWTAPAAGPVTMEVTLAHPEEQVRLTLYDAQQQVLDQSTETDATKTVSTNVQRGDTLFVLVEAEDTSLVSDYTLTIDGVMGPVAADDRGVTEPNVPVEIDLLLNDQAHDGAVVPGSVQIVSPPEHGQVQVDANGTALFSPDTGFLGIDRFTYVVSDELGNESAPATAQVTVLDPAQKPWRNPAEGLDVNGDGTISPIDALVVINYLNTNGSDLLVLDIAEGIFPPMYFDTSGDEMASPVDALLVINYLIR